MRDRIGSTLRQAMPLPVGATVQEGIGGGDRSDVYRLTLTQAGRLNVTISHSRSPVQVELLHDQNGNGRIERNEVLKRSRASRELHSLQQANLPAGTFFLRVSPQTGRETRYHLTAIAHPMANHRRTSPDQSRSTTTNPGFIEQVVNLTNAFRQQFGLQPLSANPKLAAAAQEHSYNMATYDFFDHVGIDGLQPWDRMTAQGYQWSHAAENIAAGQQTPDAVVNSWINSPSHRENLLSANLQEIGVGYYELRYDTGRLSYGRYWTQTFGTASGVTI